MNLFIYFEQNSLRSNNESSFVIRAFVRRRRIPACQAKQACLATAGRRNSLRPVIR
jgi:hypothetical protein